MVARCSSDLWMFFFFQAEDGIRAGTVTGVQTCALPISAMRGLELKREQPAHELAANLRRAFSGIVTGNVKEYGIQAIEREGPYELAGDPSIMRLLDELLAAFVAQRRMRLPGSTYRPVYRLVA